MTDDLFPQYSPIIRASISSFEVQQFWIRDMCPDRDNIAGRHKRTSDGAADHDTAEEEEKTIVLMPSFGQREKCSRCGTAFAIDRNYAGACKFHATADGEEGRYKVLSLPNNSTGPLPCTQMSAWSCCAQREESAPGCCARPHVCKEVMIRIGAEAFPTARIENIDLSVLKSVDITFFPNSSAYDLKVRVNKSLTDLLHRYFSIDAVDAVDSSDMTSIPVPQLNTCPTVHVKPSSKRWNKLKAFKKMMIGKRIIEKAPLSSVSDTSAECQVRDNTTVSSPPPPSAPKRDLPLKLLPIDSQNSPILSIPSSPTKGGAPDECLSSAEYHESPPSPGSPWLALSLPNIKKQFNRLISPHKSNHHSKSSLEPTVNADSDRLSTQSYDGSRPDGSSGPSKDGRQEGVYIKFFRLGEIRIEVCTTGFLINLSGFRAEVNEFRCQGECMLWRQLVWKLEQHAAISLIKNAAKGSFSKMTNALSYSGTSDAKIIDLPGDQAVWEKEEDSAVAEGMKRSALGLSMRKMK